MIIFVPQNCSLFNREPILSAWALNPCMTTMAETAPTASAAVATASVITLSDDASSVHSGAEDGSTPSRRTSTRVKKPSQWLLANIASDFETVAHKSKQRTAAAAPGTDDAVRKKELKQSKEQPVTEAEGV